LFGIIGIAVETFIGAVLYEFVNRNGPFNLFGLSCIIGIFITIYIYRKQLTKKHSLMSDSITEKPEDIN